MEKLINILKKVKDNRDPRGKKYPLHALLSLIITSKLCGHEDIKAAWIMSKDMHYKQLHQLGFKGFYSPSHPTILSALKNVDIISLEAALSELIKMELDNLDQDYPIQLSMDGKSINGRVNDKDSPYHLLSVFCNKLKATYHQISSNKGGGEIIAAIELIKQLGNQGDIKGKVITGDAMFANGRLCKAITENRGDYVFTAKSNQQELHHMIKQVFRINPWPEVLRCYKEDLVKEHGRLEQRSIEVINWPYYLEQDNSFDSIKQIGRITRYREFISSDPTPSIEIAYIITSLKESEANAEQLLNYNRSHWGIENQSHRVRDTLFREDAQTIRIGDSPQASAALSNMAISLLNKIKVKVKDFNNLSLNAITQMNARRVNRAIKLIC